MEAELDPAGRSTQLLKLVKLDVTALTMEQRDQLASLILKFADVFAVAEDELSVTNKTQHCIETTSVNSRPIRQYPRRMREKVDKLVDGMLKRNIIRPSNSPWSSPIVLVTKRDGSL